MSDEFDLEAYEQHLSIERARQAQSMDLALFKFDPKLHPRDLFGKFKAKLGTLKEGDSIRTPDGIKITRRGKDDKAGFIVNSGGEAIEVKDIANAADLALHDDRKTKYKSRIAKVTNAIKPFVDEVIKQHEKNQRFDANSDIITAAAKGFGSVASAKNKRSTAKALTSFLDKGIIKPDMKKQSAAQQREIATWLVDKLFGGLSGLNTSIESDEDTADLQELNLSQWYDDNGV